MNIQIQCTTNYDQFSLHPEQRGLKPSHVIKIMTSMKRRGYHQGYPIVVDKDLKIIDGQHRYQAARNCGLPIYYVVQEETSVNDVREMAAITEAWKFDDFLSSYVRQGNDNYKRIIKWKETSGLGWRSFLEGNFSDIKTTSQELKEGRFILTETKETQISLFLTKFVMFKTYFPKGWTHRGFVRACAYMFSHPNYNQTQMEARLDYQSTRLVKCPDTESYLLMLQGIYNYKSHSANVVDFMSRLKTRI